jgi:hypothetical protein
MESEDYYERITVKIEVSDMCLFQSTIPAFPLKELRKVILLDLESNLGFLQFEAGALYNIPRRPMVGQLGKHEL